MKKRKRRSKALLIFLVLVLILACAGLFFVFGSNTGKHDHGDYLYIRSGSTYGDVIKNLKQNGFISNSWSFDLLAKAAGYSKKVHPGKYYIPKGKSNFYMVRLLRAGRQSVVHLVIKKVRTKNDIARLISKNLEADSASVISLMNDSATMVQFGLDSNTALALFMPNTYDFYWNTTPRKALNKIADNYVQFWNEDKKRQAANMDLSPVQVMILASIVDEETNNVTEKDTIASVYLNRLQTGMRLQADPTARFAGGDFTIRRVTSKQTGLISPYNTYQVYGLPPGPICTPSLSSINAVLHHVKTEYLYFCANTNGSGTHLFAKNLADHLANARAYHDLENTRSNH